VTVHAGESAGAQSVGMMRLLGRTNRTRSPRSGGRCLGGFSCRKAHRHRSEPNE
jgi:hypothetical protein